MKSIEERLDILEEKIRAVSFRKNTGLGNEVGYYVFDYEEVKQVLGEQEGERFCQTYHLTPEGNFEGKNIPNLLQGTSKEISNKILENLYQYRKNRNKLHLDDKILTAWNGLMIGAFSYMYQVFEIEKYKVLAERAWKFLAQQIGTEELFVSWRQGRKQGRGFLDDYAFLAFGLLELYRATLEETYLEHSIYYCKRGIALFEDSKEGGFYLYGQKNEPLIARPKETYDGALPSGNSVMAYTMVKLWQITGDTEWEIFVVRQMEFLSAAAQEYPAGRCFYLLAELAIENPPEHIVCVLKEEADLKKLVTKQKEGADILVLREGTSTYPLLEDKSTLYICREKSCLPPVNV